MVRILIVILEALTTLIGGKFLFLAVDIRILSSDYGFTY